ncbi:MAG: hypothetical protein FWB98_00690 [Defluviitaleaceae bacterium]|nr:hypothetical protein [Defluviitaleaceae bacterium]
MNRKFFTLGIALLCFGIFAACGNANAGEVLPPAPYVIGLASPPADQDQGGSRLLPPEPLPPEERNPDLLPIGVTHASFDDVGQILHFFGGGINFSLVGSQELNNIDTLREFYAVFLNCGSSDMNSRVLREFVYGGGIVYASDLVSSALTEAFPQAFSTSSVSASQTVRRAEIVHESLAAHMRTENLDVVFNMGGWDLATYLNQDATVYIRGYVPGYGVSPLAFSFQYGEGTVFFTSFHNNAQATSDMVNFVEYLVFRIKFIEADREMERRATELGFAHQGQMFGFFGDSMTMAMQMEREEMAVTSAFDGSNMVIAGEAASEPWTAPINRAFPFTFEQGQDFMVSVDAAGGFRLRITQPDGKYTYTTENMLIVENVAAGQWSFQVFPDDENDTRAFAIGIATR